MCGQGADRQWRRPRGEWPVGSEGGLGVSDARSGDGEGGYGSEQEEPTAHRGSRGANPVPRARGVVRRGRTARLCERGPIVLGTEWAIRGREAHKGGDRAKDDRHATHHGMGV